MFVTLRTDEPSPERGSRSTRENCARVVRHDGCKSIIILRTLKSSQYDRRKTWEKEDCFGCRRRK